MVTYGQRTADDRIAFGTRGAYFYGSGIRDRFASDDAAFRGVQRVLESFFPSLRGCGITHRWGGALGIPRDWRPSVGVDRRAGLAWAGGGLILTGVILTEAGGTQGDPAGSPIAGSE